jgi:hypothetical protein
MTVMKPAKYKKTLLFPIKKAIFLLDEMWGYLFPLEL